VPACFHFWLLIFHASLFVPNDEIHTILLPFNFVITARLILNASPNLVWIFQWGGNVDLTLTLDITSKF
jgi:hypothetical protein